MLAAQGGRRGSVGFFTGCLMPEFFGPVNAATLRVLAKNGFEVHAPSAQRCCGALHAHSGDAAAAARLQARNARAFDLDALEAVVVNSAGCGAALRDAGDALASKVRDVSEFLHEAGLRPPARALNLRVAYDDPCHLLHGQRIAAAPRESWSRQPGFPVATTCGAVRRMASTFRFSRRPDISGWTRL